jgi:hypothetical protein
LLTDATCVLDPDPGLDPDLMGSLDSDPDPDSQSGYGSGSKRAKMTHKNRKKVINLIFVSAGRSLLRASRVAWPSKLGISKLQLKYESFFFSCIFPIFGHKNHGSGSRFT